MRIKRESLGHSIWVSDVELDMLKRMVKYVAKNKHVDADELDEHDQRVFDDIQAKMGT